MRPKCGEYFEVGEVLLTQIREEVLVEERKKQQFGSKVLVGYHEGK